MIFDWNHFTPLSSTIGGVLIGVAAALLILLNGRVAGISGIVGGLFRPKAGEMGWRLAFILGLIMAPFLYHFFAVLPASDVAADGGTLMLAGFFVGLGTRYGSGCTSGHGVCGLSRLSRRSMVATVVFMAAGFITVFVIRHVVGI